MKKIIILFVVFLFVGMSFTSISGNQINENIVIPSYKGNTLYVGGTGEGNYSSIQDAVDNASDGDTVFVYDDSSPYIERVNIDKSINVIGEDRDTTVIRRSVSIFEDRVNVSGFTFYRFLDGYFSDNIVISDNHFINTSSSGIIFVGVDNSSIISNTFTNCMDSIYLEGCYSIEISNNIIIYYDKFDYTLFAIRCGDGGNHIITNNTCIDYNKERNRDGLALYRTDNCIIKDNEFNGFDWGCSLSKNALFSNNIIINNNFGIRVSMISGSIRITDNNFINNKKNARVPMILLPNVIVDGNYWDDWIGLKYPILGFLPYFSFSFLGSFIDWHPAKQPYNYTTIQGCGII